MPLERNCAVSGAGNDPADRFCGECGAGLSAAQAAEPSSDSTSPLGKEPHERRFVAVLFADLVGFTQFSEVRDHEVVRKTLTVYYDRSREIVERFGGSVQKFIGDAVMAVWGATVAHEDDAERAVRAGLELTDMVARLGAELEQGDLTLRVGILTGEASVGPELPELGFVVGDLVNTASRLQTVAEPGTVVVGEPTQRMLRDSVDFEYQGSFALKGKSAEEGVWRALRIRGKRSEPGQSGWEPPFVGRVEELRLLKDLLHATERVGSARLVSIIGEAGIGKSRLAWEFRKYVATTAEDVYWHDGRSPAYEQRPAFWALSEMIRQRAGIQESDDAIRSRTRLRTAVVEFVESPEEQAWIEPRLAALLGLDTETTGEIGEFFAAVRAFFHAIAIRGTTVLVFEDFHWADTGLVEFVRELVEWSPQHPILVLTLARPDLLDRTPGWGAGRRNFAAIHLGPLTDAEMTDLLEGMVEDIAPEVVTSISQQANGIPLYAVEVVRMLLADGVIEFGGACCISIQDLSQIRVPDTVRAVIEARLDRLPADTRSLLQDAAVFGTAFTSDGLATMIGLPISRVEGLLEPLVHREVLEIESDPRSPQRGRYRFVQSMIREVAYQRLTREERRVRHIRAAEYLDGLGEIELAGAIASHYMDAHRVSDDAAGDSPLAAEAATALSEAAARAAGLHSHEQALSMIEHALSLEVDPAEQVSLWQRAARSAGALAHHDVAIDYARRALDWHQQNGTADSTAEAAWLVGNVLSHAYRPIDAIPVLEPIVAADPDLGATSTVRVAAELARAYLLALRDAEAAEMSDRAIARAEQAGLEETVVDLLITRGTALGDLGRLHEAIALLQGASEIARSRDLPVAEMRADNNLGHLLAWHDHEAALHACRRGMEMANRLGDVRFIASFTWAVAAYLDLDGQFEEARRIRDDVREKVELPEQSYLWYERMDLTAAAIQGDKIAADTALDLAQRMVDSNNPQSQAASPVQRAELLWLAGEFEAAFEQALEIEHNSPLPDNYLIAFYAAAMLRDRDKLERVADGLDRCRARGRLVTVLELSVAGSLAALDGRTDEAVGEFSEALGLGLLRLERARAQALFAAVVGRDVAQARQAGDAAHEVFVEVGADAYIELLAPGLPTEAGERAAGE
jgi:class 3 adenylate cyclase/tetratricopeptide (TPR) repeat protein